MPSFPPSDFFDLSSFAHRKVFDENTFVWVALSRLEAYLKSLPLGEIKVQVPQGTILEKPEWISIDEGTIIEAGAYIRGPCVIGKRCTIRHGAYIRGGLLAGDGCVIGHATEIKNAILLNDAHAAHFAYLGDTILGNHVNLGAGTRCANLRLDGAEIYVQAKNSPIIETHLRKFGAIVGDGSQIGCNVVTNPGTLIGPNVKCLPCLNIGGVIPRGSWIKPGMQVQVTSPEIW